MEASTTATRDLNNGYKMPVFGLGTFSLKDPKLMEKAITTDGYRMLDCASYYKNEELVGEALGNCFNSGSVARDELFIVSKVWVDEVQDCEAACKRSLQKLGLEYLDLYLIHWPVAMTSS